MAAWSNGGWLNDDEHYQILEFAQYKLGRQTPAGLAWEFPEMMRPALQPWLAVGVIRLGQALGIASPFLLAFVLRLMSTLLALWLSLEFCARSLRSVANAWLKLLALSVSCLLWLSPTIHGRFASENWGGALLVGGLCLMLDAVERWQDRRSQAIVLAVGAGLVWSAAFYCRFQIAAAIGGASLWLVVIRRAPLPLISAIALSFIAGCGLNEIVDHWFYGAWQLVPYNYFMVNIVGGKAATFGTSPWWTVAAYFAVVLILPYSLVAMGCLGVGSWFARRELVVWTAVPFVLMHTVVAHKEPRFLIPVLYLIGPMLAVCFQALPEEVTERFSRWLRTGWGRANALVLCAINVALLSVAISVPANDTYPLKRWLWEQSRHGDVTLHALDNPRYHTVSGITDTFYADEHVVVSPVVTEEDLRAVGSRRPAFLYYWGVDAPEAVISLGACTPVLRTFPEWFARIPGLEAALSVRVATVCRLEPVPARPGSW